jgi:guanine deaminase
MLTRPTSGQQYELLDWLANVTFPMEAKFKDVTFAKRIYEHVVQTFINAGVRTLGLPWRPSLIPF